MNELVERGWKVRKKENGQIEKGKRVGRKN